jgi:hypothetical protein
LGISSTPLRELTGEQLSIVWVVLLDFSRNGFFSNVNHPLPAVLVPLSSPSIASSFFSLPTKSLSRDQLFTLLTILSRAPDSDHGRWVEVKKYADGHKLFILS